MTSGFSRREGGEGLGWAAGKDYEGRCEAGVEFESGNPVTFLMVDRRRGEPDIKMNLLFPVIEFRSDPKGRC
jgi:hypothetical protein